jgi:peptidase E
MIEHWKKTGMLELLKGAYERGVIIAGLSAGAICWFTDMYTDSEAALGEGEKYAMFQGLGWLDGKISPHYGSRMLDFDEIVCYNFDCAYGIEDNAALIIEDGEIVGSVSSGGKAWKIERKDGAIQKTEIV